MDSVLVQIIVIQARSSSDTLKYSMGILIMIKCPLTEYLDKDRWY